MSRLTPPATTPFASVMCTGANSSSLAVTLLSTAQHMHAPATSNAPARSSAPPDHASVTPAATTRLTPTITRPPRCSLNSTAANTTVNTTSRFNSNDTVAAGALCRPKASSTGATAPPSSTATASRGAARRASTRAGR